MDNFEISPKLRIYRYWLKKSFMVCCNGGGQHSIVYGYSNISLEAAAIVAEDAILQIQAKVAGRKNDCLRAPVESDGWVINEDAPSLFGRLKRFFCGGRMPITEESAIVNWGYQRPIREELLEVVTPENVVTRTRYGAEVLNSLNLFFVDVDFLKAKGKLKNPEYTELKIRESAQHPKLAGYPIRLYRTHSGFRLIVQNCHYSAESAEAEKLMRLLNSDNIYAQLCRRQGCFRARLTPKPGRISVPARKFIYPEPSATQIEREEYVEKYNQAGANYAVCRYIATLNGNDNADELINYHDEKTGSASNLPLA